MPPRTTKPDIQYRTSFDFRAADDEAGFEGHAASWWSVDSYGTAMAPGAFKRTIKNRGEKIPVLWNHNADSPIGKHLTIREDKEGLYVNIGIADDGAEGTVLLKRLRYGVPLGMSFGFQTVRSRPANDDDPLDMATAPLWLGKGKEARSQVQVIEEVIYWESSPVTFPANENSAIDAIRSAHIEQQADYLSSLLEALRSGEVGDDDARLPLLQQVVSAFGERSNPDPDPDAGTTPLAAEQARRRNRDVEITLALARAKGLIGVPA